MKPGLEVVLLGCTVNCEVLNAANPEALGAILAGNAVDASAVKSDCDEQLLFIIPFNQAVKLHSMHIGSAEGVPKTLKLWINRTSMTFDDVDSFPPTQTIELSSSDFKIGHVAVVPLHFVKWQCVQSVTVFVENNLEGSDVTTVTKLQFAGMPIQTTNMNDLKKQG